MKGRGGQQVLEEAAVAVATQLSRWPDSANRGGGGGEWKKVGREEGEDRGMCDVDCSIGCVCVCVRERTEWRHCPYVVYLSSVVCLLWLMPDFMSKIKTIVELHMSIYTEHLWTITSLIMLCCCWYVSHVSCSPGLNFGPNKQSSLAYDHMKRKLSNFLHLKWFLCLL